MCLGQLKGVPAIQKRLNLIQDSVCVCRGRRVRYSLQVEFSVFCYEVFSVTCMLHCTWYLQHVPMLFCSSVCYSAVFMCLTLATGEQEKSSLQVQMREMCLLSLPQRQGPALACSSPEEVRRVEVAVLLLF